MPFMLVLVMGLPACGKTTLCRQLAAALADRRIGCLHVCYDALLNDRAQWGEPWHAWKADRKLVESSVRRLIGLDPAAFVDEQFFRNFTESLGATALPPSENVCVLLDDNFYLASMRRPFRRMANAAGIPFALIDVRCSTTIAEERNDARATEERVSSSTMKRMRERMEQPKSGPDKNDKDMLIFSGEGVDPVANVVDWLVEVLNRPFDTPVAVASEQDKLDDRLTTQSSALHQVDLTLRQAIGELTREHLAQWPDCGRRLASAKSALMRQFQVGQLAASDSDLTSLKSLLLETAQWRLMPEDGSELIGVAKHRVWQLKRQSDETFGFSVLARFSRANGDDASALREYLQLGPDLRQLYAHWCDIDSYFKKLVDCQPDTLSGIRMLAQDPLECLLSFICSSNNHISRISQMIERLCEAYGEKVETGDGTAFFDFPSLESLCAEGVEERLRELGFGYRAAYVAKTAKQLIEKGGVAWLHELINVDHTTAREALMQLAGIGPKVADCVCLMSLNKTDVVPCDTHVWQITAAQYMPALRKSKSVTAKLHNEIGQFYRERFGPYAGWAHTVLFSADLKRFSSQQAAVDSESSSPPPKRALFASDHREYLSCLSASANARRLHVMSKKLIAMRCYTYDVLLVILPTDVCSCLLCRAYVNYIQKRKN
uniref:N-glycosylase/DNA lyase n=1 Tax=Plectus sambesii TaxID=2011161 RepID=A0A914W915_9BILA